jgi:hypothetical protein
MKSNITRGEINKEEVNIFSFHTLNYYKVTNLHKLITTMNCAVTGWKGGVSNSNVGNMGGMLSSL